METEEMKMNTTGALAGLGTSGWMPSRIQATTVASPSQHSSHSHSNAGKGSHHHRHHHHHQDSTGSSFYTAKTRAGTVVSAVSTTSKQMEDYKRQWHTPSQVIILLQRVSERASDTASERSQVYAIVSEN
jgi:hypothetical protein